MNRKDWLKLAGLLGLGVTGFGAAGIGPLAGLLGPAVAGGAGAAATLPGGLSAGAALGEGLGATAGGTGVLNTGLLGAGKVGKTLDVLARANSLMGAQPQPQMLSPRPTGGPVSTSEAIEYWKRIYGGMA